MIQTPGTNEQREAGHCSPSSWAPETISDQTKGRDTPVQVESETGNLGKFLGGSLAFKSGLTWEGRVFGGPDAVREGCKACVSLE